MVVLGIALEETGLAQSATNLLIGSLDGVSPLVALIVIYGATLFATEILSNARWRCCSRPLPCPLPKRSAPVPARSWSPL
jgi:hypothetical protein